MGEHMRDMRLSEIDPSLPGGVERLIAFNRSRFGDLRMEAEPEPSDVPTGGDDNPPEPGFPASTRVADMTAEQQAAYHKAQSRKWEDRAKSREDYDAVKAELAALKDKHATDADRAVEAARQEGATQAAARFADRLVKQQFQVSAAGKVGDEQLSSFMEFVDLARFRGADGEPDVDKIAAAVASITPPKVESRGGWPGGVNPAGSPGPAASQRDVGLAEAARRFGTSTNS